MRQDPIHPCQLVSSSTSHSDSRSILEHVESCLDGYKQMITLCLLDFMSQSFSGKVIVQNLQSSRMSGPPTGAMECSE
jgi:hypothetical protein